MLELYLIAHKVWGQPAFDIATREVVEGEEMWIIPTSGHRAYPYWSLEIHFYNDSDSKPGWGASFYLNQGPNLAAAHFNLPDMPPNLRDHYTTSASPRPSPIAGRDILSNLGLLKPAEPIKRRI